MARNARIALCAALLCGGALALAPVGGAKAFDDYMANCRRWVGQGAGEQYKCFDCMKTVTDVSGASHWVNTCEDGYHSGRWVWAPAW